MQVALGNKDHPLSGHSDVQHLEDITYMSTRELIGVSAKKLSFGGDD